MHLTNSMLIHRSARGIALLGAILIAGCDNSNDPDQTAGAYSAVTLTTTANGQSFNHIANGSTIFLELDDDGTTAGLMHIEANGTEPDFNADLTGTWTQNGSTVHLEHSSDTFLKDMPLTVNGNSLTGDITLSGGGRIQLTLLRIFD